MPIDDFPWKIYKYKCTIDGHFAYILASSEKQASDKLKTTTSIIFQLVETRRVDQLSDAIIIRNQILPF